MESNEETPIHNPPEPELPDHALVTRDAVTADLPAPWPDAPHIRGAGGERPRTGEADEDGERRKDTGWERLGP